MAKEANSWGPSWRLEAMREGEDKYNISWGPSWKLEGMLEGVDKYNVLCLYRLDMRGREDWTRKVSHDVSCAYGGWPYGSIMKLKMAMEVGLRKLCKGQPIRKSLIQNVNLLNQSFTFKLPTMLFRQYIT